MQALRHFLLAMQFFTRIPLSARVAAWCGFSPEMQRAGLAYFPLVGWLVGAICAACLVAAHTLLPAVSAAAWVAAIVCMIVSVMLTGAFHEDGLADLADGLGGAVDRERALEIMKDSRIGSYGAVALVLCLAFKAALIATLVQFDIALAAAALFAAHVCSRLMPVGVVALLPHARPGQVSKSAEITSQANWRIVSGALLWSALGLGLACWWRPGLYWLGGMLACLAGWIAMLRLLQRRLQGFTGDGLGATQQVCEVAFYLGVLLCLPAGAAT